MSVTRLLLAALVGAALLVPASATAVASPTQAPARITYAGAWQGQTGQHKLIGFRVNRSNHVVMLKAGYRISNSCTITGTVTLRNISAPIRSRQFTVRHAIGNTKLVAKGTMVTRARARGTLRVVVTDTTGSGCEGAISTTWKAHKV